MKTGPHGRKHRTCQEEEGFYFRESAARRLVSAELRRFSPESVTVHPPDVCCRSGVSLKNQQKARNMCKTIGQSCVQCDSRTFEKEEIGFSCCTMAGLDAGSRQCEESPGCGKAKNVEFL